MPIKFSGKRRVYKSGAQRDSRKGKGRYDLIPTRAMRRVAVHYQIGAEAHGENNWRLGMQLRDFIDSAKRHLDQELEGRRDEDHAAAAAWNILGYLDTVERIKEGHLPKSLDNMPKLDD